MAIITLITDFGLQDEYVGVVKGVILGIDAQADIVDISHGVDPQDISAASHMLRAAYPYFPDGTVHAAVVDPGVGTRRPIIAAQAGGHRFIAPDNGLLEPIMFEYDTPALYRVENDSLFRHPVSRTFHGRDIIAPVAAHLAAGFSLAELGPAVEPQDLVPLPDTGAKWISPQVLEGRIVSIDRFGNLITNIHARDWASKGEAEALIEVDDIQIIGIRDTYAHGASGEPMALWSSRNTLEIAIKEGNAARRLNLAKGAIVHILTQQG